MKMNKLAAGALARALGLGAVAPAVAAEGKTGTGLVEFEYNEQLAVAQKYFSERQDARKKAQLAKERYEAAKKAVEAAQKKYKDLPADGKDSEQKTSKQIQDTIDGDQGLKAMAQKAAEELAKAKEAYDKDSSKKGEYETAVENFKKANVALEEANAKLAEALKREKEALPETDKNKLKPKAQALADLMKAQEELAISYSAYGIALDNEKAISEKYDKEFGKLQNLAVSAGYFVKVENSKIVVKPSETKKDNLAELKRAKADAETAIKAVKLLKELSPEKIKKVEAKLNALVAKNEELVKKADAKIAELEKKMMAFISTAYAAEEDDTDALIKELDQTTGEIKELIKDTPEDKKANEEKPAEKPEDKKENKPAKQSGKNARTGIAGVAGVAGILAAASVAYAASKRD